MKIMHDCPFLYDCCFFLNKATPEHYIVLMTNGTATILIALLILGA